jgi:hypothetical protein
MLQSGASQARSEADTGNSSSKRPTVATPDAGAGPLGQLAPRNQPEMEPAHEGKHREPPRTGLLRLPAEIIGHVADKLPPQDIIAFADTSQSLRYTLAPEKHIATLSERAQQVRTTNEAIVLLSEIQTDISRPHLQATALATLARTIDPTEFSGRPSEQAQLIRRWPNNERTALYDSVWTAIVRLPLQYQAEPLESFAPTLGELPDVQQRSDRFDAFLHQIAQLPPPLGARPLAALAPHIDYLSPTRQQAMCDALLKQIPHVPTEHRRPLLAALAPTLPDLPDPEVEFDAFLDTTWHLPAQDQGPMLEEFALTLRYLPQPAAKFGTLIEATRQLPPQDRSPTLSRLAPCIFNLPVNDIPAAFAHAIQIIEHLAPGQRTMPLEAFARQTRYRHCPATGRQAMYDAVLEQIPQLPAEHRRPLLLSALAPALRDLPEPAAKFDDLLEATLHLRVQDQGPTLSQVAPFIRDVPVTDLPAAFAHAMQIIGHFAPEQRCAPLREFTQQIRWLVKSARAAAFDHAFRATSQLNRPADQAGQLAELAGQIAQLPDDARRARFNGVLNAAIEQLPHDLQEEPLERLLNVSLPH